MDYAVEYSAACHECLYVYNIPESGNSCVCVSVGLSADCPLSVYGQPDADLQ